MCQVFAGLVVQFVIRMRVFCEGFDESGLSEVPEMLGSGGFSEWDFFGYDVEWCDAMMEEVVENGDSCRMGERFGPKGLIKGKRVEMGSFRVSHNGVVLLVNKNEKLRFVTTQNLNFEYTSTLDIYLIRILLFITNLTQIVNFKISPLFTTFSIITSTEPPDLTNLQICNHYTITLVMFSE